MSWLKFLIVMGWVNLAVGSVSFVVGLWNHEGSPILSGFASLMIAAACFAIARTIRDNP